VRLIPAEVLEDSRRSAEAAAAAPRDWRVGALFLLLWVIACAFVLRWMVVYLTNG
jgi:hypothetical protein